MVLPKYDSTGSVAAPADVSKHSLLKFDGSGSVGRPSAYGGTAPKNQSTLEFGSGCFGDITNGGGAISGLSLDALRISKSFVHKFGTSSDPIEANATTAFIDAPRAEVHLKGSFQRVIVNRIPYVFTLSSDVGSNQGIGDLIVIGDNGTVTLTSNLRVDRIFVYGSSVFVDVGDDVESRSLTGAEPGPLEIRVGRGNRIDGTDSLNKMVVAGGSATMVGAETMVQFGSGAKTTFRGVIGSLTGKILEGVLTTPDVFSSSAKLGSGLRMLGGSIDTRFQVKTNTSGGGGGVPIESPTTIRTTAGSTVDIE